MTLLPLPLRFLLMNEVSSSSCSWRALGRRPYTRWTKSSAGPPERCRAQTKEATQKPSPLRPDAVAAVKHDRFKGTSGKTNGNQ